MYDRCTGLAGNVTGILIAEKLALAVDQIRLPIDQLLDKTMMMGGNRHPHIRVDSTQRQRLYIVDVAIGMAFQLFRNGQYPNLMPLFRKLLHEIPHRGDYTVGAGGVQIRCDQYFHRDLPLHFLESNQQAALFCIEAAQSQIDTNVHGHFRKFCFDHAFQRIGGSLVQTMC